MSRGVEDRVQADNPRGRRSCGTGLGKRTNQPTYFDGQREGPGRIREDTITPRIGGEKQLGPNGRIARYSQIL